MRENFGSFIISSDQKDAEHLPQTLLGLSKESDRSVAIDLAVLVDNALTATLKRFLHQNKKAAENLFRQSGPLSSFSAKIDLGVLIGLFGSMTHGDLNTMRNIRNEFAHALHITDFSSQAVRDKCNTFKLVETHVLDAAHLPKIPPKACIISKDRNAILSDPRERYLATAQILLSGLIIPNGGVMPVPMF